MDNYTDMLLPSSYPAIRPPMIKDKVFLPAPSAEHGFSVLIKATNCTADNNNNNQHTDQGHKEKSTTTTILFDCGVSENGLYIMQKY